MLRKTTKITFRVTLGVTSSPIICDILVTIDSDILVIFQFTQVTVALKQT
jgi:hypothetical protein